MLKKRWGGGEIYVTLKVRRIKRGGAAALKVHEGLHVGWRCLSVRRFGKD
jgi:hypothetical protein